VDDAADFASEDQGGGVDEVRASISFTLGADLDNLTLTGTSAINGTGNALANVIRGNAAANRIGGDAGNDTLDGGAGGDTMAGGSGDDVYYVDASTDVTSETAAAGLDSVFSGVTRTLSANIELLFLSGANAINGTGNTLANLLRGNGANNVLAGGGGTDILEGGAGNDTLSNTGNNSLLAGGAGTDRLSGAGGNDLLMGGLGNDALTTGSGADVIVFNKGDGADTVAASTTRDNTVSLGGGARYADLLFQKSGNDLILKIGAADQITFTGYYASASNHSVKTLQMVIEGTADYSPASSSALNNRKIESFSFDGLVAAFDAARAANPKLTSWALTSALAAQYLAGSDTAAIGGDLAYLYARSGNLAGVSFLPAVSLLGAAGFGSGAQALQTATRLQDASARLS
jgi:Ca2+-binding RTX toxin-like protein